MTMIGHMKKTLNERINMCERVIKKYPDKLCIYIEKSKSARNIPDLKNHKFLIPKTITVSQFIYTIRLKIIIQDDQSLFFYVNNDIIISGNTPMVEINDKYKNEDGFLYIKYSGESTFG